MNLPFGAEFPFRLRVMDLGKFGHNLYLLDRFSVYRLDINAKAVVKSIEWAERYKET
jgi:hypothetical protein